MRLTRGASPVHRLDEREIAEATERAKRIDVRGNAGRMDEKRD